MTYNAVHFRVAKALGNATDHLCIQCPRRAHGWAYQHTAEEPMWSNGAPYSDNPADYAPMCASCHKKLDNSKRPELVETYRNLALHAGAVNAHRRSTEPEYDKEVRKKISDAARASWQDADRAERMRRTNSIEQLKVAGAAASRVRRRCSCGMVSNPAGIGRHQKSTGHKGHEDL